MQTAPMQTVDRLEAALRLAERLGYRVRLESLVGQTGGGCEVRGEKWLFVDLSLTPREQLEQVLATLRREAETLRCAQDDKSAPSESRARNDGKRTADGVGPSAQATAQPDVSSAGPKSASGFLPRWRRWYRMVVGTQSGSR